MDHQALMDLERGFWRGEAEHYREHVTDDAIFVFPGTLLGKQDGIAGVQQHPGWEDVTISEERFVDLGKATLLTYHASARRGDDRYAGRITSIYTREDAPRMRFHQHTPDPQDRPRG